MSADYWLGVLTIPAAAVVCVVAVAAYFRTLAALERVGFTFEVKVRRDTEGISDYTLRHDIWWERPFGPVFIGGWYREPPTYGQPTRRRQRNIGDDGPYVFKSCAHCNALIKVSSVIESADYYGEGYTIDDFQQWEPNTIQEARWRAQYRRKWKRRDAALYPIPGASQ